MSRRSMYFGTRDRMAWVACPAVERDSGAVGWSESGTYLNGGAFVARSKGSHRVHEMAWNMISRKEAGKIESFASGVYGDGPYYWIDPMAADHNVLPTNWAYPAQELDTGVPLTASTLGTFVATPAGNDSLPVKSIQYVLPTGSVGKKLWVPIPPGHTLHFGAYGSTSGSGTVFAVPYGRNGSVGARTPTQLADPSGNVWATSSWSGDVYAGVEFDVGSSGTAMRNLVTNPAMVATSGTVEVRRNLCTNPSFEATIGGGGWTTVRASFERSSEWSASGGWSAKVTGDVNNSNNQGDMRVGAASVFPFGMQPGKTYTISATMHTPVAHNGFVTASTSRQRRIIAGFSQNSSTYSLTYGDQAPNDTGEHRVSVTISVPTDATGVIIMLGSAGSGEDPSFVTYWDSVLVEEADGVRPYFDGSSSSPDPDLTTSWTGTVDASASVLTGLAVANLSAGVTTWTSQPYQITEPDGSKAARFVTSTGSIIAVPVSNVSTPVGVTRTVLFQVRPSVDITARPNVGYSTNADYETIPAGQWTTLRNTGTSASTSVPRTGMLVTGNTPGTLIDIRYAMLTEGEYFGDYRDGNSPGWAWTGAANASASTEVGAAVTLSGMVAQVLPNGRTPQATGWLDGLGTSGAEFGEHPERTDYSSIMDKVGLTATLVEVGTWL